MRERRFGIRVYYAFAKNKKIVLLHGGNKASQKRDINIARSQIEDLVKIIEVAYEN